MTQAKMPNKILLIDDDEAVGKSLANQMRRHQIKVEATTNLESASYLFNQQRFEVAIIEIGFADLPGLALVQKWRAHEQRERANIGIIMSSGKSLTTEHQALMKELGDLELLSKPFGPAQVLPALSRALTNQKRSVAYADVKSRIVDFYSKTGNFEKASTEVQKRLGELGPRGLHTLYELYEKAGRFEDALTLVGKLISKNPEDLALRQAEGRLQLRLGNLAEAQATFEQIDKQAPGNIERLNSMAATYIQAGDPDATSETYGKIVALSPEQPDLKFEMCSELHKHGHEAHAVAFGKQYAKPMEVVRFYNNKGVMLSKSGDREAALTEYSRALQFFPKFRENYRIYYNIALAIAQVKTRASYEEAQHNLEQCLKLRPDFEKAKNTLAQVQKTLAS